MNNVAIRNHKKHNHFQRWVKGNWVQLVIVICVVVLAAQVLIPLYFLLIRSVKTPSEDVASPFNWPVNWCWDTYQIAWEYIRGAYENSLIIAIMVSVGSVLVAAMAAYAFAFLNFPGKKALFMGFLSLIMIPGILTLLSRYEMIVKMGFVNNFWGVILPGIAGTLPYGIFLFTTFFKQIPNEVLESARVDGANGAQVFVRFIVPLSRPILVTVLVQNFIAEWNDYLWARLVLTRDDLQTLPIVLVSITKSHGLDIGYGIPFAGYVLTAIPLLVLFIFGSKQIVAGLTSGAIKM